MKRLMEKHSRISALLTNAAWRAAFWRLFFFIFACCYTELCLHLTVFHTLRGGRYPLLFSALAGALCALITFALPKIADYIVSALLVCGVVLLAEVQYIYHAIFGTFMQLSQVSMGGNVLANFGNQLLYGMRRNLLQILLLLVPVAVFVFLAIRFRRAQRPRLSWPQLAVSAAAPLLCAGLLLLSVATAGGADARIYRILNSPNTSTGVSYEYAGMFATTVQELRFRGAAEEESEQLVVSVPLNAEEPQEKYSSQVYNVIEGIDFSAMAERTEDPALEALDRYCAGLEPTKKNDCTGLFRGYNLISICAESFSPVLIDEELTPALWELSHGGFVFENYYGSFQSVTTDGEYTMNMGLFPDLTRTKVNSSFDVSIGNTLPFCLGNALKAQGYETWAYHNYIGDFYNRNITHPNMGYTFKAADSGLDIPVRWPSSDLEMMECSMDDYLYSDTPFLAYYMTFSGHYQYNWDNSMSEKNRAKVEDLPYSDAVKAYIACNLELEYALEYLMDRLEEAGKLDRTLIVLTNDHYPYGLSDAEYAELAGQDLSGSLEKYHNAFLCYVPGMRREVSAYCSTPDILPTVLNLLGVPFDSRLLAGTDALSDSIHMALLYDHSFVMDGLRYDAASETFSADDGTLPDAEQLEAYKQYALNQFIFSANVLNNDYYAHVFGEMPSAGAEELPENNAIFTDINSVFFEASIGYMYRNGYVDPVSETEFGTKLPMATEEFLDVLYRMTGRPKAAAEALPEDYGGEDFSESPYYDAVVWAFDVGLLRPEDPDLDLPDMDYRSVSRICYRYAQYLGYARPVDEAQVQAFLWTYDDLSQEDLRSMIWCYQNAITTPATSLEDYLEMRNDRPLRRQSGTTYAFRLHVYDVQE